MVEFNVCYFQRLNLVILLIQHHNMKKKTLRTELDMISNPALDLCRTVYGRNVHQFCLNELYCCCCRCIHCNTYNIKMILLTLSNTFLKKTIIIVTLIITSSGVRINHLLSKLRFMLIL